MGPSRWPAAVVSLTAASLLFPAFAQAHALPDLGLDQIATTQTTLSPATRLIVHDRTRNRGRAEARRSVTGFYLTRGKSHTGADVQIGSRTVPALRGGRSSAARSALAIPAFVPGGSWRITACADDTRRVAEHRERDNCLTSHTAITLIPTPIPRVIPPLPPPVPPRPFKLTVANAGTGSGGVTSAPAGIDCGASCAATFLDGVPPVLTATAADGSRFAGWSGGCSGSDPTCTPSADATATFALRVTAGVVGATGGAATVSSADPSASCSDTSCVVDAGTDVVYTANPAAGFRFTGWTGACSGGGPSVTVTGVPSDISCTPGFKRALAVRWTVTGAAGGTVTGSIASGDGSCGADSCLVDKGGAVTLTRSSPATGWRFSGWTGDCSVATSGTGLTFPSLSTDRNCGAVYIQQFTVTYTKNDPQSDPANTVSSSLSNGVGSCSNSVCTVDAGSTVNLTATAGGASSQFLGWTGDCAGMASPAHLTSISASKSCVAQFAHI